MKKITVKFLITLTIFVILVWSSNTLSASAYVTIKEVKSNEIVVKSSSEENQTIKIHSSLQNLIFEDEHYYIEYTKKRWGKAKLNHIELATQ